MYRTSVYIRTDIIGELNMFVSYVMDPENFRVGES